MLSAKMLNGVVICFLVLLVFIELGWSATISISGGGTDKIYAAIESAKATGATILIEDSETYTEGQTLFFGQRYDATNGRRAFNLEAMPGMNPKIVLDFGGIVAYSGSADFHIGSNSGGRIHIDARNAMNPGATNAIWYIGQDNNIPEPAQACQMLIENVEFDFTGRGECIAFGAGGNDPSPRATNPTLTLRNVKTIGGGEDVFSVIESLYAPVGFASKIVIDQSQIIESQSGVDLGIYGISGEGSEVEITRSIIYSSPAIGGDSNCAVAQVGVMTIDHCDIVNEASAEGVVASRGVTQVGTGSCVITNSIIHGDVGTAAFGAGTNTVTDSNVTGRSVVNAGFDYTNSISEPLADTYMAYGLDFSNPDNFRVKTTAASYALGSSPPVGSVGGDGGGPVFSLSGGGTGLIAAAIAAATKTGGTIRITDSETYTETQALLFGQHYNGVYGRRSFNLEAAPGTTPQIVLNGCQIAAYAGSKDLQLGSISGGRIKIDCKNALTPAIWYIGFDSGLPSGTACQMVLENLEIDVTDLFDAIAFGAGANDETPATTGASLTIRHCTVLGGGDPVFGGSAVKMLYKPSTYASKVRIENSIFLNPRNGFEVGAYQLGGDNSILEVSRTIIYVAPDLEGGDSNGVIGRLGHIDINHCDIIHEASNAGVIASRGVLLVQTLPEFLPSCDIVNSIIHGDGGVVKFLEGTGTVTDSNVTGRSIANYGFTATNCIEEFPADTYVVYGTDFNNKSNFIVKETAASYSHGADPPLGALTPKGTVAIDDWALY